MEVIPIYQTTITIVWISTGLIIMNEYLYYENQQLFGVFIGILFCCVGIKVLLMKNSATEESKAKKDDSLPDFARSSSSEELDSAKKKLHLLPNTQETIT